MTATSEVLAAIKDGNLAAVKALVAAHAEVLDARDDAGSSLVMVAAYGGTVEIAAWLAGMRTTDIFVAAALGDVSHTAAILAANPGASAERSRDGWTALHLATFFGQFEVARLLLQKGADVSAYSVNAMRNQPLHAALSGRQSVATVQLLLARGADCNARAANDIAPLHLAAARGNEALIEMLLMRGADRYAAMENGSTPADLARQRGHQVLADRLA
jgi:ankyrin repeat protein